MTAMAQEASEAPVKTFSIGFEEKQYDESGYASAVAKHLGTQHTEEIISEKQMLELVESIPQYFDEPMADSSEIPTMLVSALARKQVTVALSGDGGDEFSAATRCTRNSDRRRSSTQRALWFTVFPSCPDSNRQTCWDVYLFP